jgi:site-specific recombinase XerD
VASVPESPVEVFLERYRRYLVGERGLGVPTARGYVDLVRPFVIGRITAGDVDVAGLSGADVVGFVLTVSGQRPPKTAQRTVSALRSLLRFCHVQGLLAAPLAAAVPSVANRGVCLPRFLEPAQVESLLGACDRSEVAGRRDFAMMTTMVRLGLRAGEVAALSLGDIDWRRGEITVVGKGPRSERLPLPADVGAAIVDYLRHARPGSATDRCVFVRVKAPHCGLSTGGVTNAVIAAGGRAGLGSLTAHRLRHTAATGMLRAGAPLAQVGQVLRHRRALTTAAYAKVDRDALRELARPWPGGAA